jgi:DNA-binding GntR family transcriptional regulator
MQEFSALLDFKTREQAVYDTLRRAIIEGRWGPDEPLVVSRIAPELGVSRITISNALKRLAGEGFVRLTPHKGAVVAPLDPRAIRELYLMRAELEALAAREVAARITPSELEEARRLNDLVRRHHAGLPESLRALRAADREFHRHIRATAGLPRLNWLLENLADQCEYYRSRLLDPRYLAAPDPDAHESLVEALAARDAESAASFMRSHILKGMDVILGALAARE